jgi:hypothetical protein
MWWMEKSANANLGCRFVAFSRSQTPTVIAPGQVSAGLDSLHPAAGEKLRDKDSNLEFQGQNLASCRLLHPAEDGHTVSLNERVDEPSA